MSGGIDGSMEWYQNLTNDTFKSSYKYWKELAWNKQEAMHAIEILTGHNYVIICVDIWIPMDGGPTIPTPFVYDWSPGQQSRQQKHRESAKDFIESFQWDSADRSHGGLEPYFNILAHPREGQAVSPQVPTETRRSLGLRMDVYLAELRGRRLGPLPPILMPDPPPPHTGQAAITEVGRWGGASP